MNTIKDRYQIEQSGSVLSFKPSHHLRARLKWYALSILVFAGIAVYNYIWDNITIVIFSTTFSFVFTWYCCKEMLINIPVRYTFDEAANAVYKSSLFKKSKQIMDLDQVVIFKNTEIGSWQYKIGAKKSQFVKSYGISEFFADMKNNDKGLLDYEQEILTKIEHMITVSSSIIPTHAGRSTYRP